MCPPVNTATFSGVAIPFSGMPSHYSSSLSRTGQAGSGEGWGGHWHACFDSPFPRTHGLWPLSSRAFLFWSFLTCISLMWGSVSRHCSFFTPFLYSVPCSCPYALLCLHVVVVCAFVILASCPLCHTLTHLPLLQQHAFKLKYVYAQGLLFNSSFPSGLFPLTWRISSIFLTSAPSLHCMCQHFVLALTFYSCRHLHFAWAGLVGLAAVCHSCAHSHACFPFDLCVCVILSISFSPGFVLLHVFGCGPFRPLSPRHLSINK